MYTGVSISTEDRQNMSATLLREVSYFFPLNWKLEIECYIKEKFCQNLKIKIKFNLLDLKGLFASDLKYLRNVLDLLCVT